jgi:ketosteroid isomerase-like protein
MKRFLSSLVMVLALTPGLPAQTGPDAGELTKLLNEFLAGASRNDAVIHDRFWAEDLIYTGAAGRRIGKADIMRGLRSTSAARPGHGVTIYAAEDIRIRQYGDTAVVAFRLVATTLSGGKLEVANYFNTGTFLKRNGKWQVVAWQATRIPRTDDLAKKEVGAAESAFHQAILDADIAKLKSLIDESFIWTHQTGEQTTRQQLLDELASGRLKYVKLGTSDVSITIYRDAAVVRGVSDRQRSSVPGSAGVADASPFKAYYTLTFINRDGAWKAVAMHSSRST